MEWKFPPDDAALTWAGDELAGRLMDIGIAVRLSTGEVVAGRLDDLTLDRTALHIDVGQLVEVPTAGIVAYVVLDEPTDHSDELRGI